MTAGSVRGAKPGASNRNVWLPGGRNAWKRPWVGSLELASPPVKAGRTYVIVARTA